MTKENLIRELQKILPAEALLTDGSLAALDPVIRADNNAGLLAVRPQNQAQIAAIFALCTKTGTPLIPQGGRTGLAGAASGTGSEILLLGNKMPRRLSIDPQSQTALVSTNITLAELEEAVRAHGLSAGIDIAARDSATIGGMISTNAGGMEAFRNGTMRQRVLGIEAVLPDGTILDDLAHVRKCNEGYDIKQLLIGAEGTLGYITAATLQLVPAPPDPSTFLLALTSAAAALDVLKVLQSAPAIRILRAEAMWATFAQENGKLQTVNPLKAMPDAPLYVIYELHSSSDPQTTFFESIEPLLESGAVLDAIAAQNGQQANEIWMLREDTLSMGAKFPFAEWFDISIPLAHLDEMVATIERRVLAIDPNLKVSALGHLADGNLHYSIYSPIPITPERSAEIKPAVLDGLKPIGGSFSAEHGIGIEKRWALQRYGDPGKRALMRAIKQTLDPANICNPGKVL